MNYEDLCTTHRNESTGIVDCAYCNLQHVESTVMIVDDETEELITDVVDVAYKDHGVAISTYNSGHYGSIFLPYHEFDRLVFSYSMKKANTPTPQTETQDE